MKNQIIDYLQITTHEYDEQLFMRYWNWCVKYGQSEMHIQQLLCNVGVNNWWMYEFTKLEKRFCDAVHLLPKTADQLDYHYNGFVAQIIEIYPIALINGIRKSNMGIKVKLVNQYPALYVN